MSNIKIEKKENELHVTFIDSINEKTDFKSNSIENAEIVKIFFQNVKYINSLGVREWVKWINTNQNSKIRLYECPRSIIDQVNMFSGFFPSNALVLSFYVPYHSEQTDETKNILFRYGKEFYDGGKLELPQVLDSKGLAMNLDIFPEKYFNFLKSKN